MFESELTAAFLDHWQSLRKGSDIPRTEDYLDNMDVRFAPVIIIFECSDKDVIVRFQGTKIVERWGQNRTHESWLAPKSPPEAALTLANMYDCVSTPCGGLGHCTYFTRHGRAAKLEALSLPLAVSDNRPRRLVMLSNLQEQVDERDGGKDRVEKNEMLWFDVGFGVPRYPVRRPDHKS